MTRSAWTPRTPQHALTYCDTLLAELTPHYRHALTRLEELQPGHSGRPAGTGEPGGGSGFTATSIVERTTLTPNPERNHLERARTLPTLLADQILAIGNSIGHDYTRLPRNPNNTQRLTWTAWVTRALTEQPHLPAGPVRRFHAHVCELHDIVTKATQPPTRPTPNHTHELAQDLTGNWCTSCLRVGAREPRSPRYTTIALCRWCGDFHAHHGTIPTPNLVEHHQRGKTITEAMIRTELTTRRKKKR